MIKSSLNVMFALHLIKSLKKQIITFLLVLPLAKMLIFHTRIVLWHFYYFHILFSHNQNQNKEIKLH